MQTKPVVLAIDLGTGGPKAAISLRLDTGVVNHLRAQGRGWQTRVNDALARLIATGQL